MPARRPSSRRPARPRPAPLTARTADRYRLYLDAVQDPPTEVARLSRLYHRLRRRHARTLREDFCGTAGICCDWARSRAERTAVGVDIDPEPLAWGARHNLSGLTDGQRARVRLVRGSVLSSRIARLGRFDVICALNFSYWVFRRREIMLRYFQRCRRALAPGGLLVLDFFGGSEVLTELRERTRNRGFTYVWDQADYDPVSGDWTAHIHFEFRDGTVLRRAFTYHWRLWTIPELRDLLAEAGFRRVRVMLEGDAAGGGGDGVFRERRRGQADRSFIAYLAAER